MPQLSLFFLCSPATAAFVVPGGLLQPRREWSRRATVPCNTALSEEAAVTSLHEEADAFFSSIDENGDGLISFSELSEHLSSLGYKAGAIDHVLDLLDINRDGEISPAELRESFIKYDDPALRTALGLSMAEADGVFRAIDANGDGEISRAELAAYLESNGYDGILAANTIFDMMDVNSDGSVSQSELRAGYSKYSALRSALGIGEGR